MEAERADSFRGHFLETPLGGCCVLTHLPSYASASSFSKVVLQKATLKIMSPFQTKNNFAYCFCYKSGVPELSISPQLCSSLYVWHPSGPPHPKLGHRPGFSLSYLLYLSFHPICTTLQSGVITEHSLPQKLFPSPCGSPPRLRSGHRGGRLQSLFWKFQILFWLFPGMVTPSFPSNSNQPGWYTLHMSLERKHCIPLTKKTSGMFIKIPLSLSHLTCPDKMPGCK